MVGVGLKKKPGARGRSTAAPSSVRPSQPGSSRETQASITSAATAANSDSDGELLDIPFVMPPEPLGSVRTSRKRIHSSKKLALLELILEKKPLLFAQLTPGMENTDKQRAWEDVREKALALEIITVSKDWVYVRDKIWGCWKSRSLEKRDNSRKTGAAGGAKYQLTEVDEKIYEIIGEDSPVIEGFAIPESLRPAVRPRQVTTHHAMPDSELEAPEPEVPRKKRRVIAAERVDLKRQKQVDLQEIEFYFKQLQCLKLEKELHLQPSKFTKDIPIPVHEQIIEVTPLNI